MITYVICALLLHYCVCLLFAKLQRELKGRNYPWFPPMLPIIAIQNNADVLGRDLKEYTLAAQIKRDQRMSETTSNRHTRACASAAVVRQTRHA